MTDRFIYAMCFMGFEKMMLLMLDTFETLNKIPTQKQFSYLLLGSLITRLALDLESLRPKYGLIRSKPFNCGVTSHRCLSLR